VKCIVCGAEIQSDEQLCPVCIELEHKVQVLTPEEKQDFSGITIEQDQGKQTSDYDDYHGNNEKQRIYVKHVNFSMGQTGILTKIILGIIFTGLIVVALPIALLVISIIVFFLYLMRK
jgi:hypothetical protein